MFPEDSKENDLKQDVLASSSKTSPKIPTIGSPFSSPVRPVLISSPFKTPKRKRDEDEKENPLSTFMDSPLKELLKPHPNSPRIFYSPASAKIERGMRTELGLLTAPLSPGFEMLRTEFPVISPRLDQIKKMAEILDGHFSLILNQKKADDKPGAGVARLLAEWRAVQKRCTELRALLSEYIHPILCNPAVQRPIALTETILTADTINNETQWGYPIGTPKGHYIKALDALSKGINIRDQLDEFMRKLKALDQFAQPLSEELIKEIEEPRKALMADIGKFRVLLVQNLDLLAQRASEDKAQYEQQKNNPLKKPIIDKLDLYLEEMKVRQQQESSPMKEQRRAVLREFFPAPLSLDNPVNLTELSSVSAHYRAGKKLEDMYHKDIVSQIKNLSFKSPENGVAAHTNEHRSPKRRKP